MFMPMPMLCWFIDMAGFIFMLVPKFMAMFAPGLRGIFGERPPLVFMGIPPARKDIGLCCCDEGGGNWLW